MRNECSIFSFIDMNTKTDRFGKRCRKDTQKIGTFAATSQNLFTFRYKWLKVEKQETKGCAKFRTTVSINVNISTDFILIICIQNKRI